MSVRADYPCSLPTMITALCAVAPTTKTSFYFVTIVMRPITRHVIIRVRQLLLQETGFVELARYAVVK